MSNMRYIVWCYMRDRKATANEAAEALSKPPERVKHAVAGLVKLGHLERVGKVGNSGIYRAIGEAPSQYAPGKNPASHGGRCRTKESQQARQKLIEAPITDGYGSGGKTALELAWGRRATQGAVSEVQTNQG